jgi:hypothetical protein
MVSAVDIAWNETNFVDKVDRAWWNGETRVNAASAIALGVGPEDYFGGKKSEWCVSRQNRYVRKGD